MYIKYLWYLWYLWNIWYLSTTALQDIYLAMMLAQEDQLCLLIHTHQVKPLWQLVIKKVHAGLTHVGGLWCQCDGPQEELLRSFKTSFSLMRHMESSICPLSPGPLSAEGGVAGKFMVVLDTSQAADMSRTLLPASTAT